ncbi:hypothetical protein PLCT1_01909 [Planctomycetaceae bacterium]|nr:hypothetical protein PLCT1_01909 [Planctomycetaceae bacterium]
MAGYNNQNLNNYGNPAGGPPPARPAQPQPMQGIPPYSGPRPAQPQAPQGPRPAQYPPPGAQYPPPGAPPYPVGAYGPPPGVPAFRPRPSGPNPGVGIVKIIFGLIFAVVGVGVLMKEGHKGFGEAAPFGFFAGLGAAMVVAGGLNCARKKLGFLIWAGVVVVLSAAFTGAGPSLSDMHYEREEAQAFEECKQYPSTSSWKYQYFAEYKLPAKYWRNEARSEFAFADAKESCDSKDAAKIRKSLKRMNFLIAGQTSPPVGMFEYDQTEMVGATPVDRVKEGRALCVAALKTMYEAAAAKLKQPAAKPKEGEVKVDEKLRTAFIALLAELADAEDSIVYVEFTNATKLDKPKVADDLKSYWEVEDDTVKAAKKAGGYKIIDPGEAFSPRFDKARRRVCLEALREAFKAVFNADLLTLQALENGADRKGKIVLEISSLIVRQPSHYKFTNNPGTDEETLIGMLFAINVEWKFKLLNRAGADQYQNEETSNPAGSVRISRGADDPDWAAYSVMMDSAYYNYSRKVAGAFGLTPPAEKISFRYTAAEE